MALKLKKKKAAKAVHGVPDWWPVGDPLADAIAEAAQCFTAIGWNGQLQLETYGKSALDGTAGDWGQVYRTLGQLLLKTRQDAVAEAYEPVNELIRKLTALGVSRAEIADAM